MDEFSNKVIRSVVWNLRVAGTGVTSRPMSSTRLPEETRRHAHVVRPERREFPDLLVFTQFIRERSGFLCLDLGSNITQPSPKDKHRRRAFDGLRQRELVLVIKDRNINQLMQIPGANQQICRLYQFRTSKAASAWLEGPQPFHPATM